MNLKATNKTETNKYELEVEISAEDFNKALSEVAKTEGKKMSVPGFRKGHAPRSVIEKMYGENVFFEAAVDKLYRPAMQDAIEASGLEVIAVSNADVTSVSRENGIELKLTVVVKPVITIEGYKGIEATKKNVEVTDEDVSAELVKVQDRNSRMVDVDNRGALTGDTAVIDFEGFCDGKAFEGGKAEGFELSLGSGQFIPGFEDQIIGKNIGDEFDVNVKFPEDYHAKDLAGKDATFKCKLNAIEFEELPALDDDFAKDASEFETFAEYKADVKAKIEARHGAEAEVRLAEQLTKALTDNVEAEIPEALIDREKENLVREYDYQLRSQGLSLDMILKYTGMSLDDVRARYGDMATINVKKQLALEEIVKAENIEASDEEVEKKYNEMAEQFGMKVEDVKSRISKDDLAYDVKSIKAFELVKENAKITEKSVTAEELEKLNAPETTEESEEKSEETEEKPKKKTTRKPRAKKTAEPAEEPTEE